MKITRFLTKRVGQWRRDETGSISVETIMMVPLMVLVLMSTLVYFDAFRAQSAVNRTGLTLADTVSRETGYFTPEYLTGLRGLQKFLTTNDASPDLRLTVISWDEDQQRYEVRWSRKRGGHAKLSTADLNSLKDQLPIMADNTRAIIVETWSDYSPPAGFGLTDFEFGTFTVVSPRYSQAKVCWNSDPELDPAKEKC